MATKMLLRSGTCNQLLEVLNGPARSVPALTNCSTCPRFSFEPTSKPITTKGRVESSSRRQITSVSLASGATGTEHVASLRFHKAPPSFHLCKRLLSDSKTEDGNGKACSSSEDTEKTDSRSLQESEQEQESDDLDILDKDTKELSESSIKITERDLFNSESSESKHVERTETGSENSLQHVHSKTRDDVENVEEVKDETSVSLIIRTKPEHELDFIDDQEAVDILAPRETPTVLEEFIQPYLPTESLTLATYVDHSPTLQKLVELGVDLSKVEKKAKIGNMLIKMDFDRHMKDKIILLHSVGMTSATGLGRFLTINPFFLTEDLENLKTRLRYLRSKKFSEDAITQVLNRAPYFLSFSVERVDSKLGFYQKELSLTGNELRNIITKTPKLVTFKIQRVKENIFVCRQQLGFTTFELKNLILKEPKLLLRGKEKLIGMFDYLHNHMGIPHKQILKNPTVFNGRVFRMQERHQFLRFHGRAQYDPTQPGYVALERLAKLPDDVFCQEIAKSSKEEYDNFLKTL
ncbi:transcription termination factor 3, mitochondrial-like [Patiria miniata]|uniref:Transcription termination factor 3, mitochondrial n=1 Tax=Patiria miniata TaxID=46514 RepID=A0A913ZLY1_PATMI|nr:transcription termination factor 3, mitochondrial-like [Patiria miniata]XP_038052069.1 transcription termination factor 3, mitochondrial-like [Patiria miniata]XP_038052071.1 transcription termination factor 3, mitochondrial-like [Patiria miniata]